MHNAKYTWIPLTEQDLWNCTEVRAHRECLDQVNCSSYEEYAALCCFVSVCRHIKHHNHPCAGCKRAIADLQRPRSLIAPFYVFVDMRTSHFGLSSRCKTISP